MAQTHLKTATDLVNAIQKGLENRPEERLTCCQWGCDTIACGKRYTMTSDEAHLYQRLRPTIPGSKKYPIVRIINEHGRYTVETVSAP